MSGLLVGMMRPRATQQGLKRQEGDGDDGGWSGRDEKRKAGAHSGKEDGRYMKEVREQGVGFTASNTGEKRRVSHGAASARYTLSNVTV